MNDIYKEIIDVVLNNPEYNTAPRGMEIKELTNATITLTNPKNCLITLGDRRLNYAFAIIEKLEYLSGQNNPTRLFFYNKNTQSFANVFGMFDGAYPERFHYWRRYIYNLLKADKDTRQAVIPIYGPQDRHISKDIPCTIFHQFFVRDNKLHMTVYMRSNDILWGVPYDVNGFCFILEAMASILGLEMGTYTHMVGSLHAYTEREDQLAKLLTTTETVDIKNPEFCKSDESLDFEELMNQLNLFWVLEEQARKNKPINEDVRKMLISGLQAYFDEIHKYAKQIHER